MGKYDFILDQMIWSHSRISTHVRCPKCFFLNYILKKELMSGCFGEYGSFGHKLFEKCFKNELLSFELATEYKDNFTKEVPTRFPPNQYVDLAMKYFNQGLDYFENFNGLKDDYEILGVEKNYDFEIDKYNFTGVIDLEVKNKCGWFEIVDHKSKSEIHKKKLAKKDNPEEFVKTVDERFIPFDIVIQLYLYCIPFKEVYKEYPKYLNFNMFKINDWYQVEFNEVDLDRSIKWATDSIKKIYADDTWLKGIEATGFWCDWICSTNTSCTYSNRFLGIE